MLSVTPVAGRHDTEAFIRLAGQVFGHDPNWVEPLWLERRRFLSPRGNPFFQHAEAAFWLARRRGRPVGRISAQIDRLAPEAEGRKVGYFGMLASEQDGETVAALFGAAEEWLAARGVGVARGPFDLSINHSSGLLVEGFDTPPSLMMNHNPPWLAPAVEQQGYAKVKDLVAYVMDTRRGLDDRLRRVSERVTGDLVIRSLDRRRYKQEIRLIADIFNDAWAGNWGFTPLTEAEAEAMAEEMKPILDPELVKIAEVHGEPVSFIVMLPNLNEAISSLGGRLFPFGWARLLWRLKVRGVRSARVPLMGTRRHVAMTLLGRSLPLKLIYALEQRSLALDIRQLELSWLLEDNWQVRRVVEAVGGRLTKVYRIYEKALG